MALINIEPNDLFFEKILHAGLADYTKIKDVILIERSEKWEEKAQNFYSNITKFTLKYTYMDDTSHKKIEKFISLILKEEPSEGFCLAQVRQSKFFETEINVLGKIIPEIEKMIKIKIAPQFIYGSESESLIVMQNLTSEGYKNKDCKLGFSRSHVLMLIEKLAKFHAGSVALNEQQGGILQNLNRYDLTKETPENIFKNIEFCTRTIGKIVSDLSDKKCAGTAPKFEKLATKISQRLLEITKHDENEFCVLNHGDCWTSNIMFREDNNGKPIDIRLIDFQISVWSSPAIDLLFFLSICPELHIKYQQDDYFIQEYLNNLSRTMKDLKCKTRPPTMNELKESMYKRRSFAVKCGLIFNSKLLAGDDHIETIEDILQKGCSDVSIFRHPATLEALKKIVPLMDDKGYLD